MNRAEKQRRLAQAAQTVLFSIEHGTKPFFGNQGVTLYATPGESKPGDIVGTLIQSAAIGMPNIDEDITDPKEAVALILGVSAADLPVRLQVAINSLAITADDTKRSYKRRVPKLVKLLDEFATEIVHPIVSGQGSIVATTPVRFTVPGKSL